MSGEVVGIICGGQEDENNSVIRAVEATQLRSLLRAWRMETISVISESTEQRFQNIR